MKNSKLMNSLTKSVNKVGFQLKKYSPEILVVAGGVGIVVSTVMACKATLKVNEVTDETKKNIEKIHEATEKGCTEVGEDYSVEDSKKDLAVVYAQTGMKLAKLYAPAVALGTLSLGCVLTSNNILRKRNVALAAAYATIDKSFKEYRGRVVERFGEEVDRQLKYNIKAKEVEEKVVDEKTGEEKTVKKTIEVTGIDGYSDYARFFDSASKYWEETPEYNLMFLRAEERYANDLLRSKGYLFLNDVYEMLGIPRSEAGQSVGWIYDEENPVGDNYVDFGIYELHREANRDFVNGYEPVILLDFNVDGNIMKRFQHVAR